MTATRPRRERLRLVPLLALVLGVLVAATVGWTSDSRSSAEVAAEAAAAAAAQPVEPDAQRAARARKACTPAYDPRRRGEPWQGKRRAASEKAFQRRQTAETEYFVRGRQGWFFFGDLYNDNFSQALGRDRQSRSLQKAWAKRIRSLQSEAASAGADFRLVVAPANWEIEHRFLPRWAQALRGSTSLDRFLQRYPDLPVVDVRGPLARADRKHRVYEPLNSHWTPYGGYVAWKAITKCLRATSVLPDAGTVRPPGLAGVSRGAPVNEFAPYGIPDGKPVRTSPVLAGTHPPVSRTSTLDGTPVEVYPDGSAGTQHLPLTTRTTGALSPLKLLALRDSTGDALSPLWDWTFAETDSYLHGIGQAEPTPDLAPLLAKHDPDVVLLVVTQRFLAEPPTD